MVLFEDVSHDLILDDLTLTKCIRLENLIQGDFSNWKCGQPENIPSGLVCKNIGKWVIGSKIPKRSLVVSKQDLTRGHLSRMTTLVVVAPLSIARLFLQLLTAVRVRLGSEWFFWMNKLIQICLTFKVYKRFVLLNHHSDSIKKGNHYDYSWWSLVLWWLWKGWG